MKTMLLAAAALLAGATPAFAQADASATPAPLPDPNDRSDTFTIGAGVGFVPDYEGSNDYRLIPAAAMRGRVGGISFNTRSTYLYVDFVPRGAGRLELNATFSSQWPNLTRKKDSPADADEHKGEEGKYDKYFSPEPGEGD